MVHVHLKLYILMCAQSFYYRVCQEFLIKIDNVGVHLSIAITVSWIIICTYIHVNACTQLYMAIAIAIFCAYYYYIHRVYARL